MDSVTGEGIGERAELISGVVNPFAKAMDGPRTLAGRQLPRTALSKIVANVRREREQDPPDPRFLMT